MSTINHNDLPPLPAGIVNYLQRRIVEQQVRIMSMQIDLQHAKQDIITAWGAVGCLLLIVVCLVWQWPQGAV